MSASTEAIELYSLLTKKHPDWQIEYSSEIGEQVTVYRDYDFVVDAACNSITYGGPDGLLEVHDGKTVQGWLTANQARWLIEQVYKGISVEEAMASGKWEGL